MKSLPRQIRQRYFVVIRSIAFILNSYLLCVYNDFLLCYQPVAANKKYSGTDNSSDEESGDEEESDDENQPKTPKKVIVCSFYVIFMVHEISVLVLVDSF